MTVNGVDMSIINNMISQINAQKASLAGQIDKAKADFGDDGLFNGTVDGAIGSTDLTMEKVQNMSFEEITELLNTASDAEIKASLDEEENKLAQYLAEFDKIQNELNKLEEQLNTLQNELETLQTEKRNEEAKLRNYETRKEIAEGEVSSARAAYELAKTRKADAMEDAENAAYEAAMEEYSEQVAAARFAASANTDSDKKDGEDKDDDDSTPINFASILTAKRNAAGISSSYDSAIASAAQTLADAKAEVKRYDRLINAQTAVIEAKVNEIRLKQTAITNKNSEITSKGNELTPVSNKIQESQNNITALQQTMAVRNFINENKESIMDVKYEKDPAVAQSKQNITDAENTVATQLETAKAAETAAAEAAKRGDKETAEAEKAKAEEAKRQAEAAKAKAEEEKAKLVREYGETRTADQIAKVESIANNVTAIGATVTNAAKSVEDAQKLLDQIEATRQANGVTYAESVDEVTGESVQNRTKLDLTSMISPEELAIVEQYGLDLTELVEKNGGYYPKYIIARGGTDGKYHIYQRSETIDLSKYESNLRYSKGASERATDYFAIALPRIYGNGPSWDICSVHNGYMSKYGDSEYYQNGYQEVYYVTGGDCMSAMDFGNTFKSYATCSPLSLDLNGDGVRTSENVIDYDIDGDGEMDRINDSADAVLVFDKDGDGVSGKDGSECFGDNTDLDGDGKADGYANGFEALKALALREGLINNNDDMDLDENDIKYLEQNFGFKIKAGGYNDNAQSLSVFGITTINLARTNETTLNRNFDEIGNDLMTQTGATFVQNGELKEYADLWHKKIDEANPFAA